MPPDSDYIAMTSDILLKGNLRKAKNWNKRYFVLREGNPAKLEYYENEKKWKSSNSKPKRRFNLEKPWNIGKNKDTKHEFLIVIFTEDEYLSMAAENAEVQDQWVKALRKAIKPGKDDQNIKESKPYTGYKTPDENCRVQDKVLALYDSVLRAVGNRDESRKRKRFISLKVRLW